MKLHRGQHEFEELGLPRYTTADRLAYTPPQKGYKVFDTDLDQEFVWDGITWQSESLRGVPVADNTTLTALTARDYEKRKVLADGKEYVFELGAVSGTLADDAATGFWQEQIVALSSTLVDSSASVFTQSLTTSTNSGNVLLFTNIDVTNTATLVVPVGQTLNGVVDGTFLFSNYAVGTQFRADEVVGGWVVSVVGASNEIDRVLYSVRGISVTDMNSQTSGGITVIELDDVRQSRTTDSGIFPFTEVDNYSIRSGNVLTIPSGHSGLYELSLVLNHEDDDFIDGEAVQSTTNSNKAGLRINGTDIEWFSVDDATGLPDLWDRSGAFLRNFNEGDTIEVVINSDGAGGAEEFIIFLMIKEVNVSNTVLAGMVTPEDAEELIVSGNIGDGDTLTLPADLSAYEYVRFETDNATGFGFPHSLSERASANSLADNRVVLDANGATAQCWFDFDGTGTIATLTLTGYTGNADFRVIGIKAQKTVIMPDALEVEDLSFGTVYISSGGIGQTIAPLNALSSESSGITQTGAGFTIDKTGKYFLTPHASLVSVQQDIELKVNGVTKYTFTDGSVSSDTRGMTVNIQSGDLITLETTPAADWAVGSDITTDPNATRVGVIPVAGKTVINTTDTPVDDQSSSGYFDIGNMRMQWGVAGGTGASRVETFTVPFGGSPVVTMTADQAGVAIPNLDFAPTTNNFTFTVRDLSGTVIDSSVQWQAIGLKP